MSIVCRGRRYPNAPLTAFTGALGRVAPHFMMPNLGGFTGADGPGNGFRTVPYRSTYASKVVDPENGWWLNTLAIKPEWDVAVYVRKEAGSYFIYLDIGAINVDGGEPFHLKRYRREQAGGFDWGTFDNFELALLLQSPGWTFGGAPNQTIFCGTYGLIPPNSCTGA